MVDLATALAESKRKFRRAQRTVPLGPARTIAFAEQAAELLTRVDALGISRERADIIVVCRMSEKNVLKAEALGWRWPGGAI